MHQKTIDCQGMAYNLNQEQTKLTKYQLNDALIFKGFECFSHSRISEKGFERMLNVGWFMDRWWNFPIISQEGRDRIKAFERIAAKLDPRLEFTIKSTPLTWLFDRDTQLEVAKITVFRGFVEHTRLYYLNRNVRIRAGSHPIARWPNHELTMRDQPIDLSLES